MHVVTANEYLAKRDAATNADIFRMLGMSVGVIHPTETFERTLEEEVTRQLGPNAQPNERRRLKAQLEPAALREPERGGRAGGDQHVGVALSLSDRVRERHATPRARHVDGRHRA